MPGLCLAMRWPMCCCAMPSELPLAAFVVVYYNKEKKDPRLGMKKGKLLCRCAETCAGFCLGYAAVSGFVQCCFCDGCRRIVTVGIVLFLKRPLWRLLPFRRLCLPGKGNCINTEPISSLPSEVGGREYPVGTFAWIVIFCLRSGDRLVCLRRAYTGACSASAFGG